MVSKYQLGKRALFDFKHSAGVPSLFLTLMLAVDLFCGETFLRLCKKNNNSNLNLNCRAGLVSRLSPVFFINGGSGPARSSSQGLGYQDKHAENLDLKVTDIRLLKKHTPTVARNDFWVSFKKR